MFNTVATKAGAAKLAFPVLIEPPGKRGPVWTVKSDAQNRPLRMMITYDAITGAERSRTAFADRPLTDRVVSYGIAWHEGQLFVWFNEAIGVFTALALLTMMVSGLVLWRRRRPQGWVVAPPRVDVPARMGVVVAITLVLAALLPLQALSLVMLLVFDRLVLPRLPRLSAWLS